MNYGIQSAKMIDVNRVFLDLKNPRHNPFEDQEEAIDYLCQKEQVLALARDIATNGLSPLELFALISNGDKTYFSAEGNRRLCALKLLNDPDLAPANLRKEFEKLASTWNPIEKLFAIIFTDHKEVNLWLDRIHAGFAEGRGRRQWNAEQKARNSGYSKNDLAQMILDIGQERGYITQTERQGRLSTVQRYLGNQLMRDALGLDISDFPNLSTDLPEDDFNIVVGMFLRDVAIKRITTRDNASAITNYSHQLRKSEGVSSERTSKYYIAVQGKPTKGKTKAKPKNPPKPKKIALSEDLQDALNDITSYKLSKIYYSLCSLSLARHTPLLSVGAWSFIETLTARSGRKRNTDFHAYLSGQKLQEIGLSSKENRKSVREAVKRISELGNSTKHDHTSASFNGEQLANDIETMEKMLIALAKKSKGTN